MDLKIKYVFGRYGQDRAKPLHLSTMGKVRAPLGYDLTQTDDFISVSLRIISILQT